MTHIIYRGKGSTPNQALQTVQEQCFSVEKRSCLWCGLWVFHCADLKHAQKCYKNIMKDRQKPPKHDLTSLIFHSSNKCVKTHQIVSFLCEPFWNIL